MPERLPDKDLRTDEGLMLAYKDGDAAAFAVLYGRWRRRLFRYVAHQCGQNGVSDELYQDIWLRVVNARRQYEPGRDINREPPPPSFDAYEQERRRLRENQAK